ncbi:uncharacterized protein H6S33_012775 [Morchella sextelata]|uniref:uncharacterized protein n=1 Tax=Morchella sextelata TaxID=1174677 RepID=UPI001D047027|nr:uncharacterized protein H6S33_012775 [Morchella sextelata]KAH0609289.1 hypothetical protein H6S33_012775 [Morchella sextelata]
MHDVRSAASPSPMSAAAGSFTKKAIDADVLHKIEMNCTLACLLGWSSDQMWMLSGR